MPGLKFRVLLDSDKNEEVFRDIVIANDADFETFYHAIMEAFAFKGDQMASFYVSNDSWDKGHELSLLDLSYDDDAIDEPASVMKQALIQEFIQDPDQRFILVYDFMRMWIFLIELIAYEKGTPAAPMMALAIGTAPTEQSRALLDENLFGDEELGNQATDEDDDEFGFQDFDDDYADDDLTDYNEYDY
ncbi:MAG: IS1096 element passenger TnpR family protein [Flavobacteriales bacterium]